MSSARKPAFESASLRSIERLNPKLLNEVREKLGVDALVPEAIGAEVLESLEAKRSLRNRTRPMFESMAFREQPRVSRAQMEAIVLQIIRPPLLVKGGTIVRPADMVPEVELIVDGLRPEAINPAIERTARVELGNVPGVPFVGTGWIVKKLAETKFIVVTNRHVAEEFARPDGRGAYNFLTLPNFHDYQANVDFLEEHQRPGARQAPVVKIVFMAGADAADIALLEVEGEQLRGLDIIELSDAKLKVGAPVGVVGYPAYDSRSDPDDVAAYFGDIFDVKRFSFGNVTSVCESLPEFTHDATTLGGNSGSVVIDRDSGKAVGIHFAGDYKIANYAVPASEIKAALDGLDSISVVPSLAYRTEAPGDGRHAPEHFKGRDGYAVDFFGPSKLVKPPKPGTRWEKDLTAFADPDTGKSRSELKYRHFSVWMCQSRKLPLMTAVNIDGGKAKRMGRIDKWYIDGRIADTLQVDNAAYAKNPLDRGHMVRREDPVWGSMEIAAEANLDTFHYTNAAPQHEDLNQRDWVGLEDYVLANARTRGLKVSVFTGPVLGDKDPPYKGLVRLPKSFWKIVAVIDSKGKLSVTGYLLCQGDMIKGLTGEFVYGGYKTYQVEVTQIGQLTLLDVAHLAKHDPFAKARKSEGLAGDRGAFRSINGPSDLIV